MSPPALLSINEGDQFYKCMGTGWLVDSNGPFMFRFISKLRQDQQIELVFFSQRQDNRKYVLQHISFAKEDFLKAVDVIRETIWQIFPEAKVKTEDFAEINQNAYRAVPANKWGMIWIGLVWRFGAVINKLRWLFTHRPPC